MPRNVYFSQGTPNEQALVEDLTTEALKIYGFDCYYLPRNMVDRDTILNEAILSKFDKAYMVEMYMENVEGFGGDGTLLTKFGLEIREQATFVVSRRQWLKLVGNFSQGIINTRPTEGDLIYLPLTKSLFEIKWVETKSPFFQLQNVAVWKMTCELFEYGNDEIKTGIEELDSFQQDMATETYVLLTSGSDMFEIGETVTQIVSPATGSTPAVVISGQVLRIHQPVANGPITMAIGLMTASNGKYGMFALTTNVDANLIGSTSGAAWDLTRVYDIADTDVELTFVRNNEQAQNQAFETAAKGIIDFSEQNPFGEPTTIG